MLPLQVLSIFSDFQSKCAIWMSIFFTPILFTFEWNFMKAKMFRCPSIWWLCARYIATADSSKTLFKKPQLFVKSKQSAKVRRGKRDEERRKFHFVWMLHLSERQTIRCYFEWENIQIKLKQTYTDAHTHKLYDSLCCSIESIFCVCFILSRSCVHLIKRHCKNLFSKLSCQTGDGSAL